MIRISVKPVDIEKAQRNSSMRCVVAQAIARTMPDAHRIEVDTQTIRWSRNGERHVYITPYAVQGYVVAFDAGESIEPFSFGLDPRRRVPVQTHVTTEAGKKVKVARAKKIRATRTRERVEQAAAREEATPTLVAKAKAAEAKAITEHAAVKAATAGKVTNVRVGEGRTSAPPRVYKTSTREYGHRVLRINQVKKESE